MDNTHSVKKNNLAIKKGRRESEDGKNKGLGSVIIKLNKIPHKMNKDIEE